MRILSVRHTILFTIEVIKWYGAIALDMAHQPATTIQDESIPDQDKPKDTPTTELCVGEMSEVPIPKEVSSFTHREVPNTNTTTWERRWSPVEDTYPHLRLTYSISTEHVDGWEITRRITLVSETVTVNMPNNKRAICTDIRDTKRVTVVESFERAREIVTELLQAASTLPEHTPPTVNKIGVASYRDLERGGNGRVDEEEVEELVGGGGQ